MPNRILRDWTDSYHVEPLSSDAERLFVRLIMKADDFGRYHADPRLIKAGCFPLLNIRDTDISRWIAECEKAGVIAVYTVASRSYLAIIDFRQRLRESKSKFPPPEGKSCDWCPSRDGPLAVDCQSIDCHVTARASNTNTPPSPIPEGRGKGEGRLPGIPSSEKEAVIWASMEMVPPEFAREVFQQCEGVDWKDGVSRQITNWRSYVKARWSKSQKFNPNHPNGANGSNRRNPIWSE